MPEPAQFHTDTISSVVDHMNSEHADACLLIVQAFTHTTDATQATLTGLDANGMDFEVVTAEDQAATCLRVNYDKPIRQESQIRGILIGMTKQARQKLGES